MRLDQTIFSFSALSKDKKAVFLCSLGMRLTILLRVYREEIRDESQLISRISNINEMNHKIFGYIGQNLSLSQSGYPDDVFVSSLIARAQDTGIDKDFVDAWNFALKFTLTPHQSPHP
jgi:hypothetical protein